MVEKDSQDSRFYVREVYDGENALEQFEYTLDKALEEKHEIIVIEPTQLGNKTENWIACGNCLQNTSILTGFGSVLAGALMPQRPMTYVALGALSVFLTALYGVSWLTDPCIAYQVDRNGESKFFRLTRHQPKDGKNGSAVVLVRRRRKVSNFLHASITVCAVCVCAWSLVRLRKNP